MLERSIQRALVHIDPETDGLRVYYLCAACAPHVDVYGRRFLLDQRPVRIQRA